MIVKIPIDFVAGSHGHYLETVCNQEFGIVKKENNFTSLGTSHAKSAEYQKNKLFDADHWFDHKRTELLQYQTVVSINFERDDLLLLSSISLLRAGGANIDNNDLECNTITKLLNSYYQSVVTDIKKAYPLLDLTLDTIPRNVLREYFKFGFKNPEVNGYWLKQQQMQYSNSQRVLKFNFSSFYNVDVFAAKVSELASNLGFKFTPTDEFYQTHQKFLNFNPYVNHKNQCDEIVNAVVNRECIGIPKLSLFQESYINGCLENIYNKEMPFHQDEYCTSTKDVLYYLEHIAPDL